MFNLNTWLKLLPFGPSTAPTNTPAPTITGSTSVPLLPAPPSTSSSSTPSTATTSGATSTLAPSASQPGGGTSPSTAPGGGAASGTSGVGSGGALSLIGGLFSSAPTTSTGPPAPGGSQPVSTAPLALVPIFPPMNCGEDVIAAFYLHPNAVVCVSRSYIQMFVATSAPSSRTTQPTVTTQINAPKPPNVPPNPQQPTTASSDTTLRGTPNPSPKPPVDDKNSSTSVTTLTTPLPPPEAPSSAASKTSTSTTTPNTTVPTLAPDLSSLTTSWKPVSLSPRDPSKRGAFSIPTHGVVTSAILAFPYATTASWINAIIQESHSIQASDKPTPTSEAGGSTVPYEMVILAGEEDGFVHVYDGCTGLHVARLGLDSAEVSGKPANVPGSKTPSYSHNGPIKGLTCVSNSCVCSGGADGFVRMWDWRANKFIATFTTKQSRRKAVRFQTEVTSLAYDSARRCLFAAFMHGVILGFSVDTHTQIMEIEGHEKPPIYSMVVDVHADVLFSSAADVILILIGKELHVFHEFCLCAHYDPLRGFLFYGNTRGIITIIKVVLQSNKKEARVMKRIDTGSNQPIVALWYHSRYDILVTADRTDCVKCFVGVTRISFSQGVDFTSDLSLEIVSKLLSELEASAVAIDEIEGDQLLSKERDFLSQCAQLFEGETAGAHIDVLAQEYLATRKNLEASLMRNNTLYSSELSSLKSQYLKAIHPEKCEADMISKKEHDLIELKKRHQKELLELERVHDERLRLFHEQLPSERIRAASHFHSLKATHTQRHNQLLLDKARAFRNSVCNNFTVLSDKYLMGPVPTDSGSFKGISLSNGQLVSIKSFPEDVLPSLQLHLKHPALLPVLDLCRQDQKVYIVTPHVEQTLPQYIASQPNEQLTESAAKSMCYSLLKLLAYLHRNGLVHRDLRPGKILVSPEGTPFLTHFGIMRSLTGTEVSENGMYYSAPEIFLKTVNIFSDSWSMGCILLYIFQTKEEHTKPIFTGKATKEILRSMVKIVGQPSGTDLLNMSSYCRMSSESRELLLSALTPSLTNATTHAHAHEIFVAVSAASDAATTAAPSTPEINEKILATERDTIKERDEDRKPLSEEIQVEPQSTIEPVAVKDLPILDTPQNKETTTGVQERDGVKVPEDTGKPQEPQRKVQQSKVSHLHFQQRYHSIPFAQVCRRATGHLQELIEKLLVFLPRNRLLCVDALKHQAFTNLPPPPPLPQSRALQKRNSMNYVGDLLKQQEKLHPPSTISAPNPRHTVLVGDSIPPKVSFPNPQNTITTLSPITQPEKTSPSLSPSPSTSPSPSPAETTPIEKSAVETPVQSKLIETTPTEETVTTKIQAEGGLFQEDITETETLLTPTSTLVIHNPTSKEEPLFDDEAQRPPTPIPITPAEQEPIPDISDTTEPQPKATTVTTTETEITATDMEITTANSTETLAEEKPPATLSEASS
ncbi:Protein kinase domain [Pelomyxa schiedti]|nr:Protein kinase domain [Pelomyxa schiedti]